METARRYTPFQTSLKALALLSAVALMSACGSPSDPTNVYSNEEDLYKPAAQERTEGQLGAYKPRVSLDKPLQSSRGNEILSQGFAKDLVFRFLNNQYSDLEIEVDFVTVYKSQAPSIRPLKFSGTLDKEFTSYDRTTKQGEGLLKLEWDQDSLPPFFATAICFPAGKCNTLLVELWQKYEKVTSYDEAGQPIRETVLSEPKQYRYVLHPDRALEPSIEDLHDHEHGDAGEEQQSIESELHNRDLTDEELAAAGLERTTSVESGTELRDYFQEALGGIGSVSIDPELSEDEVFQADLNMIPGSQLRELPGIADAPSLEELEDQEEERETMDSAQRAELQRLRGEDASVQETVTVVGRSKIGQAIRDVRETYPTFINRVYALYLSDSELVSTLSNGTVLEKLEISEGETCYTKDHTVNMWGSPNVIKMISYSCEKIREVYPELPPLRVTSISWKKGGRITYEDGGWKYFGASHDNGNDVDFKYIGQTSAGNLSVENEELGYLMPPSWFNHKAQYDFLRLFNATEDFEISYISEHVKRGMCRWAYSNELTDEYAAQVFRRMFAKKDRFKDGVLVRDHDNHIHIRMRAQCPVGNVDCVKKNIGLIRDKDTGKLEDFDNDPLKCKGIKGSIPVTKPTS